MTIKSILAPIACAAALIGTASATVVFDEAVSGDARNDFGAGTMLGTLTGDAGINGSVQGNGVDERDVFTFTATSDFTIDLLAYDSGANNTSTGLLVLSNVGDLLVGQSVSQVSLNVLARSFAAGTYSLALQEFGSTSAATYSLLINASEVPLPAAAPLMLAGLGGLGFARRKARA